MPVGVADKSGYQVSIDESWLAPPAVQPKIVAFIGPSDDSGNELLSIVAAAIAARDKQVIVLQADGDPEDGGSLSAGNIGRLKADYLLVGLPFRPTSFARSVLSGCDLVIVTNSCKIEFLAEAENIVKVLLFLGIEAERVAGVVVDPEGILSSASLADIKPYLESNLGIEMAGVVSFGHEPGQLDRDIEQLVRYIK